MKKTGRANALLLEVLLAVLFFSIASVTIIRVFARAHEYSLQAGERAAILTEAQEIAERLTVCEDCEAELTACGFTYAENEKVWKRESHDMTLCVTVNAEAEENSEYGTLRSCSVYAVEGNAAGTDADKLFTLPCLCYIAKEGTP